MIETFEKLKISNRKRTNGPVGVPALQGQDAVQKTALFQDGHKWQVAANLGKTGVRSAVRTRKKRQSQRVVMGTKPIRYMNGYSYVLKLAESEGRN
jgi:hypothetical protein